MGGGVDPNQKLTDGKAFVIILKCFIGGGMLSLPFALAHAGMIMGIGGLIVLGLMAIQGILYMAECSLLLQKKRGIKVATYPALATAVAGPKLGSLVSVVVTFAQLGVCCVMVNFCATNLLAILPCDSRNVIVLNEHTGDIKIREEAQCFGMPPLPAKRLLIWLILPIFIALSWLPSIKAIAPLAKAANYFMAFVIASVLFYAARSFFYVGVRAQFPPRLSVHVQANEAHHD